MEVSVKAYGKVLIFGAYSILEPGNIGLVVNIDKGTTATAQETQSGRVIIDLQNFQIQVYGVVRDGKLELTKNPEIVRFIENAVKYLMIIAVGIFITGSIHCGANTARQ